MDILKDHVNVRFHKYIQYGEQPVNSAVISRAAADAAPMPYAVPSTRFVQDNLNVSEPSKGFLKEKNVDLPNLHLQQQRETEVKKLDVSQWNPPTKPSPLVVNLPPKESEDVPRLNILPSVSLVPGGAVGNVGNHLTAASNSLVKRRVPSGIPVSDTGIMLNAVSFDEMKKRAIISIKRLIYWGEEVSEKFIGAFGTDKTWPLKELGKISAIRWETKHLKNASIKPLPSCTRCTLFRQKIYFRF